MSKLAFGGALFGVFLPFFLSPVANAGELGITQAAAQRGGVTPHDAPGFPITITQGGRYRLDSDLQVPANKVGIEVIANNVTINFSGYSLSSVPALQALDGIHTNVTGSLKVMNGSIIEFGGFGINADGLFMTVENMRVIFNAGGGVVLGDDSTISGSLIARNSQSGVFCRTRCVIKNSSIVGTNGYGASVSTGSMVLGNLISGNSGVGLAAGEGASAFGNNSLIGNAGGGNQAIGQWLSMSTNVCSPDQALCN